MYGNKTVVYSGPTILHAEVMSYLPEAKLRPPAARGDVYREDWAQGDRAIIIDGYFRERLSVGHKEILWLLDQGVETFGSASIGALRAAELYPYGMVGVGSIFDMYAAGEIEGDDEVAVLHGPEELGFCPLSVAMVNLRYACRLAVATGAISPPNAAQILQLAKGRPFFDRTWDNLRRDIVPDCLNDLEKVQKWIEAGNWNLKKLDAIECLTSGQDRVNVRSKIALRDTTLSRITMHEAARWRSRRASLAGYWMSDFDVLDAARLFDSGYPELHQKFLSDLLTEMFDAETPPGDIIGIEAGAELPTALRAWLTVDEQKELSPDEQHRRIMVRVWPCWHASDWRPMVLDRMRVMSRWSDWEETVHRADEIRKARSVKNPPPEICGKLFLRHWSGEETSAQIKLARRGFYSFEELGHAVERFFALDIQQSMGLASASSDKV
jgi:hypothetical protein